VRALAVNGWNNTVDNNVGKTFGVQGIFHVHGDGEADLFAASLGYLAGPERDDTTTIQCPAGTHFDIQSPTGCSSGTGTASGTIDRGSSNVDGLRHFLDLVLTSDPIPALHLVVNGSLGVERLRTDPIGTDFHGVNWFGLMGGVRYAFTNAFAVAARGEYLRDSDGTVTSRSDLDLSGVEIDLVSGTLTLDLAPEDNLVIRLDNRLDWSNREIFPKQVRDLTGQMFTTTLGVVVKTD
jgi:Putative beta-barrel porin-2, OmpL-like. bbp2